jgi:hypothetical protein
MLVYLGCTASKLLDDGIRIIDAASPNASARLNECRPKTCIVRQSGMRRKVFTRCTRGEATAPLFCGVNLLTFTDEVDCAVQTTSVNHDLDHVSLAYATDWAASERLRRNMP